VPGVLHDLESQTEGLFRVSDFRPVPCPHPACSACTYAYIDGGRVIPIPRLVNVDDYLELALNRAAVDLSPELAESLERLWSMSAVIGTDRATEALVCAACGIEPAMLQPEALRQRFFMVQVHALMDEHNFDLRRVMKCCVHQLLPDGRAIPLCVYNNLPYRRQVRAELEQGLACRTSSGSRGIGPAAKRAREGDDRSWQPQR
jgi:hypothetical protein